MYDRATARGDKKDNGSMAHRFIRGLLFWLKSLRTTSKASTVHSVWWIILHFGKELYTVIPGQREKKTQAAASGKQQVAVGTAVGCQLSLVTDFLGCLSACRTHCFCCCYCCCYLCCGCRMIPNACLLVAQRSCLFVVWYFLRGLQMRSFLFFSLFFSVFRCSTRGTVKTATTSLW